LPASRFLFASPFLLAIFDYFADAAAAARASRRFTPRRAIASSPCHYSDFHFAMMFYAPFYAPRPPAPPMRMRRAIDAAARCQRLQESAPRHTRLSPFYDAPLLARARDAFDDILMLPFARRLRRCPCAFSFFTPSAFALCAAASSREAVSAAATVARLQAPRHDAHPPRHRHDTAARHASSRFAARCEFAAVSHGIEEPEHFAPFSCPQFSDAARYCAR